ncbi:hypothetical protein ACN27J_03245 [Solwaraspora sp. WMMB762]|uniref:hypothetical protein n=1 Tax=Solwaraspora sp. WMMB762 TaxID=3404120 RepID=UPI003B94DBBE
MLVPDPVGDSHWGRAVTCDCRTAGQECHCYSDDYAGLPTTFDELWWEDTTEAGPALLDQPTGTEATR